MLHTIEGNRKTGGEAMRLFIFILAGAFILTGCSDTDEVPVDEPEVEETGVEGTDTGDSEVTEPEETEEVVDQEENTKAEETSKDDSSESTETAADESSNEEGSEDEPAKPVNLMADIELVEGHWINYSGEDDARGHMTRTNPIEYNGEQDYTVTTASYVSYFYGDEFIKTNNYGHDGPHIIENVPEADRVIVSFNRPEQDTIELINKATEEASAGNEISTTPDELLGRGKPVEDDMAGTIMFGQEFLTGDDVFTGERIDNNGNFVEDENYYVTGALEYDSGEDYVITAPAYISYYKGRNFIETEKITAVPAYLPEVKDANYINISFHDDHLLELNIIELE